MRSRWKGAKCVPATTIGCRGLARRNGYAQGCVGHWCRQFPVGAPAAHCKRSWRPSAATCATHFKDRAIAEAGCWLIRCSPRTFPLEAAAVRLGQSESEERVFSALIWSNIVNIVVGMGDL